MRYFKAIAKSPGPAGGWFVKIFDNDFRQGTGKKKAPARSAGL
jgi:hypothetical protein